MSLVVDDLRVYYRTLVGDVRALDGVTFRVADGEIVGLAGESGCGKSTLGVSLVRLDGRMRYIGGRVEIDDVELPIWDEARMDTFRFRVVSIIPQYAMSALNPTRKVGRLVREFLAARGVDPATVEDEFERRLGLVGLPASVVDRYPMELSGGMKQRLVIVLSSLLDPSVLIADEVTSALDVSTQKAVAKTLVELRDRGMVKSLVVITHDLAVLAQMADTILVMYAGKLAEKGPTAAVIEDPRHPYTRLLLHSLPEVGARFTVQRLAGIPGSPPSLINPPSGCRFRDRCPIAGPECVEEPPFVELEPGRWAACWKAR